MKGSRSAGSGLRGQVRRNILSLDLLKPGELVLVALSGGPDSVALLHVLRSLSGELGFSLGAAHLNHGIRGALADRDEAFCSELCASLEIPLIRERADVPALARREGMTLEEAARCARYGFLRRAAKEAGAGAVALGHHGDDQAETVLLNLGRGSGLPGLCGMPVKRECFIRPMLLSVYRQDILDSLRENNLPSVEDETNGDGSNARGRLRALMPALEDVRSGFCRNAARFAGLAQEDEQFLRSLAEEERNALKDGSGLDAARLAALPRALSGRILRLEAEEYGLRAGLEQKHVDALLALCGGETGKALRLPRGLAARLSYGRLLFERRGAAEAFERPLQAPGVTPCPGGEVVCDMVEWPEDLSEGWPYQAYLDGAALDGAVVRSRRPGDRIHPLGGPGSKKLQDLYVDRKIDRADRELPVIARGSEILFAVGAGLSERAKAAFGGRVVRVRYQKRS